jgi:hypothetical protein
VPAATPEPVAETRPHRAERAEREEETSRPAGEPPDVVLRTGLELAFRPTPADAFVLVDGTQIGRATEWSGLKGARTFTLSGPGEHRIKLRSAGMTDYRIVVQASETAGVTPIFAPMKGLPAAEADASDLKTYRVRESVAFKVDPPGATIFVDGQPAGPARNYGGHFGQPGSWLRLPQGRHRIGVAAPGRARQDFLVEVFEGAEKDRDRIEATLQPGGAG